MGVKNLWDILESCKKILPLHHLQWASVPFLCSCPSLLVSFKILTLCWLSVPRNFIRNKRLCVDLSCWMVQLQNVSKSHNCMREKVYLKGLFHRLRALIALNCSIIFVTDGSIPAIKLSTYRRRLNSGNEISREETNLRNVSSLRRNMGSEFSCMIKEAKMLGQALGIPVLDGIEEAEAQCALLNSESLCDGCFTSDSDIFLFGAKTVYRDICLGDGGYVVCYEMADIERQLGFGRNSLIALALLLGSDYSQGVHGFGRESACQVVKSAGDDLILQRIVRGGLPFLKKSKGSKKQGRPPKSNYKEDLADNSEHKSDGNEQLLLVINAYTKPKCHSADSDAVHGVLSQHPFKLAKVHQICSQLFDWPPEITDEYILPKMAERDLRRFANLQSKSAAVGLELPLHQVPVKCPVSGIVKPRKVQGRECFEVLLEGLEGLKTSIVPADLLESACPEKIREFEESIAQKKKQRNPKPRHRKLKNCPSVAEIDLKLQNLMLDINLGRNTYPNTNSPPRATAVPENKSSLIEIDASVCNPPLGKDFDDRADSVAALSSSPVAVRTSGIEFVDLLSPSPAICTRPVSKCREVCQEQIDVIDLSESENDVSPEHARKARELRLFIAHIRNDID